MWNRGELEMMGNEEFMSVVVYEEFLECSGAFKWNGNEINSDSGKCNGVVVTKWNTMWSGVVCNGKCSSSFWK